MKSSVQHRNFRKSSLSVAEARHTLLAAMAADAEKLRQQAGRIKELRKAKERREGVTISQETAAHEIGVSSRTYRTWEGTGADLKPENMKALAAYFDSTVNYIEHGMCEPLATPDLSSGAPSQLDAIEDQLKQLTEQIEAMRLETAARALAVIARLDEALPPATDSRRQRRA